MYKVFFEDRLFILSEFPIKGFNNHPISSFPYIGKDDLMLKISLLRRNESASSINVYFSPLEELYKFFSELFYFIEAAGGIVINGKGEALFIFRQEKWDLPKGKMENGERIEATAIREVEEECGINNVEISNFLTHSYHIYNQGDKLILKKTWWYRMLFRGHSKLKPQIEEDITEVKWVSPANADIILNNTYESIKQVFLSFYSGS